MLLEYFKRCFKSDHFRKERRIDTSHVFSPEVKHERNPRPLWCLSSGARRGAARLEDAIILLQEFRECQQRVFYINFGA